jgi:arylsulfatase A-like enzyme
MTPNILIFMTDQQRGDVVHPEHPCITPNASRLAKEGLRFTNAYCPSPHCCPSRATFMTGLYPSQHGVYNNVSNPTAIHRTVFDKVTMFSETLADAGYNLAYAGKWHVSNTDNPAHRGWDELKVRAGTGSYMHTGIPEWTTRSFEEPAERKHGHILRPGWGSRRLFGAYPTQGEHAYESHDDYTVVKSALDALPGLVAQDQPWCLYVGTFGPHDDFVVPQHYVDMYDLERIPLPANYGDSLRDKPVVYQRMREMYWSQFSEQEVRDSVRHYWAFCTMEDELLGLLLDKLEELGAVDNTLVLFVSDHGEYCGSHGLYCKGIPSFREAYHIPAIVRYPKRIVERDREEAALVSLADFAPTFLELAKLPIPDGLAGRSLVPFLDNEAPTAWRDALFAQCNGVELYYTQRTVMTREYKYVYNGFDWDELYDLQNDPHELTNLAKDPNYDEIKHDLVRRMWRFAAEHNDELIMNPYYTVALAPWGPADALGD